MDKQVIYFWQNAAEFDRFAADAFEGGIGKPVELIAGEETAQGTLLSASVANDGRRAWLGIECPLGVPFFELLLTPKDKDR